jgi:hypothetical protein
MFDEAEDDYREVDYDAQGPEPFYTKIGKRLTLTLSSRLSTNWVVILAEQPFPKIGQQITIRTGRTNLKWFVIGIENVIILGSELIVGKGGRDAR